jgi:hypothetical protein
MTVSVVPVLVWRSIHIRRSSLLQKENIHVLTKPKTPVTFSDVNDTASYFQWRHDTACYSQWRAVHRLLLSATCTTPPVTFSDVQDTTCYFQWRPRHSLLLSVTCTTPPVTFSDVHDTACYFGWRAQQRLNLNGNNKIQVFLLVVDNLNLKNAI